jgi:hypothetical protein
MTLWQTSNDLRLTAKTAGSLAAGAVAKSLRLEAEAARREDKLGLGLNYRSSLDSSG